MTVKIKARRTVTDRGCLRGWSAPTRYAYREVDAGRASLKVEAPTRQSPRWLWGMMIRLPRRTYHQPYLCPGASGHAATEREAMCAAMKAAYAYRDPDAPHYETIAKRRRKPVDNSGRMR